MTKNTSKDEKKPEKLPSITVKQEMFVLEYLVDLNATQAAIRAGYSPKSATHQGSVLLSNPNVSKHIDFHMKKRARRVEITADSVLDELAGIGFARVEDFVKEDGKGGYERKKLEEMGKFGGALSAYIGKKSTSLSISTRSKTEALELIGKHIGMFNYEPDADKRDRESNTERIRQSIRRTRERAEKREKRGKKK